MTNFEISTSWAISRTIFSKMSCRLKSPKPHGVRIVPTGPRIRLLIAINVVKLKAIANKIADEHITGSLRKFMSNGAVWVEEKERLCRGAGRPAPLCRSQEVEFGITPSRCCPMSCVVSNARESSAAEISWSLRSRIRRERRAILPALPKKERKKVVDQAVELKGTQKQTSR